MNATCDLATVLKGDYRDLSKRQFNIVITRYNEPLEWTRGLEHLCTVYNKGDTKEPFDFPGEVINVPNHGVGCETILRHIRDRYWELADVTLFCQATLCDRSDQPMFPLASYMKCPVGSVVANTVELNDVPKSRYLFRISDDSCRSLGELNFGEWRKKIGLPYKPAYESWVRGDWIAVGRGRIQKRGVDFYKRLYDTCSFERGILVEECWFLERTFYRIFGPHKI